MSNRPDYLRIYVTFLHNSLVREMSFRANFVIECISSLTWMAMNIGLYLLVFLFVANIGPWEKWEFFAFLATSLIINSIVGWLFMPSVEEFSELIRTGGLDFLLLKPADTQFLVSLQRTDWSSVANLLAGIGVLGYCLWKLTTEPTNPLVLDPLMIVLYIFFVLCGVAIMYSVMIVLAATSIWLGRNQSLYDFWFYITNFSRYPMEIYHGWPAGDLLRYAFLYVIPVLIVVNVPARVIAQPLRPETSLDWSFALFAIFATLACLLGSRWIFQKALLSYRSASS